MISPAVEGHSNHPNNSTACHHIATLGWKTGVEKDHLFPHSLLLSDTRTARKLTLSYSTLQVLVMTFQVAKKADLLGPHVQLAVGLFRDARHRRCCDFCCCTVRAPGSSEKSIGAFCLAPKFQLLISPFSCSYHVRVTRCGGRELFEHSNNEKFQLHCKGTYAHKVTDVNRAVMEYTARAAVHTPGSSWRQVIMGDKLMLDLLYHLHADRNFRGTRTVHARCLLLYTV